MTTVIHYSWKCAKSYVVCFDPILRQGIYFHCVLLLLLPCCTTQLSVFQPHFIIMMMMMWQFHDEFESHKIPSKLNLGMNAGKGELHAGFA